MKTQISKPVWYIKTVLRGNFLALNILENKIALNITSEKKKYLKLIF